MKGTEFEYRHQALVRMAIVVAAFGMYLFDPGVIVWKFLKDSSAPRPLERAAFLLAAILIGIGAAICTTVAVASKRALRVEGIGKVLFAIGLASLAPPSGFSILIGCEVIRVARLAMRESESGGQSSDPSSSLGDPFRQQAAKWGLFFTMLIFAVAETVNCFLPLHPATDDTRRAW